MNKSWNPVLNKVLNLKHMFIDLFGEEKLWDYGEFANIIEYWEYNISCVLHIKSPSLFSPLKINQYGDFVLFKYSLLDTDSAFWYKENGFYRECRSVVIDVKNEELVLTPFRKFFNLNEIEETLEKNIRNRIEKASFVEISDKMDGSMQSVRYYNGKIILTGSQALDPEKSYRVKIGYEYLTDNHKKMLKFYPNYTFIFEMISQEDKHVVKYLPEQNGLYLIGIRNIKDGKELPYSDVLQIADKFNIKHTITFNKTFDQILNSLNEKSSDEAEGFVLNIDGYKIKLKYNDYVKIHHMLSKITSTNTIIKCIDDGTWDDVKSKLPTAYRADAEIVAHNIYTYIHLRNEAINLAFKDTQQKYQKYPDEKEDRKSFMFFINKYYKDIAAYLIILYNKQNINFIRTRSGKYIKYYEIMNYLKNTHVNNKD